MAIKNYNHTVAERLMRYVQIDTTADPNSTSFPSTEIQKDLGRLLVQELLDLGVEDAEMDEWGYVFGTVKGNTSNDVPTVCFCAHMDTAPDVTGKNVKPILQDRKSTRLNSSHVRISYAVFCLKKKKKQKITPIH